MKSKVNLSLMSKLLILFLLSIIIPLSVLGVLTYTNTEKIMRTSMEDNLQKILDRVKNEVDLQTNAVKEKVEILNKMEIVTTYADELNKGEVTKDTLQDTEKLIKDFFASISDVCEDIIIMDKKGSVIMDSENSKFIGMNNYDREYFQESITGKNVWSEVIKSKSSNEPIITYNMPLKDSSGNTQGVITTSVKLESITNVLSNVTVGNTGYAFMIDKDGVMLYHPIKDKILTENAIKSNRNNTELYNILTSMANGEESKGTYTLDGIDKLVVYRPSGSFSIGLIIPVKEYMVGAVAIRDKTFLIAIITVILGAILAIIVSKQITKPIINLMKLMKIAENGDLTVSADINSKDEIGQLSESFNNMILGQRNTIINIEQVTNVVASTSLESKAISEEMASSAETQTASTEELTAAIDQMSKAIISVTDNITSMAGNVDDITNSMREITSSSEELANNAEESSKGINEVSNVIEEINTSIERIAENSITASNESQKTVEVAEEGKAIVENTIGEMENIISVVHKVNDVIRELGNAAGEIGEIVEVINDIAEQTNLLSLNASIEAARAGEHGKGFAVVASAIGNLAEKSGAATKDIAKLINEIQKEVKNAVKATEVGASQVDNGVELVKNTGQAFDKIFHAVNNSSKLINEIASSIEEQSKANHSIMNSINKINDMSLHVSSIAEEQTACAGEALHKIEDINNSVQDIASASEEQSSSSEEILSTAENVTEISAQISSASEEVAGTAEDLSEQVESLKETVSSFKLK